MLHVTLSTVVLLLCNDLIFPLCLNIRLYFIVGSKMFFMVINETKMRQNSAGGKFSEIQKFSKKLAKFSKIQLRSVNN